MLKEINIRWLVIQCLRCRKQCISSEPRGWEPALWAQYPAVMVDLGPTLMELTVHTVTDRIQVNKHRDVIIDCDKFSARRTYVLWRRTELCCEGGQLGAQKESRHWSQTRPLWWDINWVLKDYNEPHLRSTKEEPYRERTCQTKRPRNNKQFPLKNWKTHMVINLSEAGRGHLNNERPPLSRKGLHYPKCNWESPKGCT